MFRASTLILFKMLFAVFGHLNIGISANEFDLLNPARKSLELIAPHKAKSAVVLLLE